MIKKLTVIAVSFVAAVATLFGTSGAASAVPAKSSNIYADCYNNNDNGPLVAQSVSSSSTNSGFGGYYLPGDQGTCYVEGLVNRAYPLVAATMYTGGIGFAATSRSSAPRSVRIGTGSFDRDGDSTLRITIPKKTAYGYYSVAIANLFDSNQTTYTYICVGDIYYCD